MTQIKTRLSERRAKAAREIIKRYAIFARRPGNPHKLEMAEARNGELLVLYDDEIIATRGDRCWITQKEGVGVFDDADLSGLFVINPCTDENGKPIRVGDECHNAGYEAYRQRLDGVTLN
jgi:hypothetical protein